MPWQVPITVDGLEYPVTFNTEGEPSQQDYDDAVQQILSQKTSPAPKPEEESPGYLSQLGSALGLGYRQMKSGVGATFNALTGDTADVAAEMAEMSKLQREQQAAQTPEDVEFMRSLEEAEQGFEKASGPLESIGALAQYPAAVLAQPGAAFKTAVQSAPNALISGATSLAGYGLGGLVGGAANIETGPGAILTGIAGAMAGGALSNTLMEAGPAIFDVLNERTQGAASNMTADEISAYLQQNPDIVEEGMKTGAIRGSVIGAVESLGVKGSGRLLTIPERAAARAVQKELVAAGVDVASKEAVDQALLDPALRATTKAAAEAAKGQFSSAGNMARLAGASAIDTGAAGAGELAAQAAAGQEISTKEAFMEMLGDTALSLPMSVATKAVEGAQYMLNPALIADVGEVSVQNLADTGNDASAEAQDEFNKTVAEILQTPEPTVQPEQAAETPTPEVTLNEPTVPEEPELQPENIPNLEGGPFAEAKVPVSEEVIQPAPQALNAPDQITDQESLRQELQDRTGGRKTEETGVSDSLRSPEEVEEKVAPFQEKLDSFWQEKPTPEAIWELAESSPEGVWVEDGSGTLRSKKSKTRTTKRGTQVIEFETEWFNEDSQQWEPLPQGYTEVQKRADGSFASNNSLPTAWTPGSYTEVSSGKRVITKPIVASKPQQPITPKGTPTLATEGTPTSRDVGTSFQPGATGEPVQAAPSAAQVVKATAPGPVFQIKRSRDFLTSGNYDVTTPDGVKRIFRDPETGAWMDADEKAPVYSPLPFKLLGYSKKEALDSLRKEYQTTTVATNETAPPPAKGEAVASAVEQPVEGSIPTVPTRETPKTDLSTPESKAADQEEQDAQKRQKKQNESIRKSLDSIIDKRNTNIVQGTVTAADAEAARTELNNSGEIPNAFLTRIYESPKEFLADKSNERYFPSSYADLQANSNIEGLFENGQTLIFVKNIGVSDLDRDIAKNLGISPELAAARRVIAHENGHRGVSLFTLNERREFIRHIRRKYSDEEIQNLVRLYTKYADWRTNPDSRDAALEELFMKKFDSFKKIPTGGVWDDIVQFLKKVWRRLTGSKDDPTLNDMKDVVRLLRNAMQRAEVPPSSFTLNNGGEVRLREANPEFASPETAAFNAGSEAARDTIYNERDMDVREAIRRAYQPTENSVAVPLDELFAKAKDQIPDLSEDEFSNVLQDLYEDSGAVLQEGESAFGVFTPEGRRAGFAVIMPRQAMASRIEAKGEAVKRFQEEIDAIESGSLKGKFEGVQFKNFEAIERPKRPSEFYTDAAQRFVDSLIKENYSLEDIGYSIQSPDFLDSIGISSDLGAQQAVVIEIKNRVSNAIRKERLKDQKKSLEKLEKSLAGNWQGTGSKTGSNQVIRKHIINNPRYRGMFIRDKANESLQQARENVTNSNVDDAEKLTRDANKEGDQAADRATEDLISERESSIEDDQDAIDLAEGEATLDTRGKNLWEKFKDLIRKRGIAMRALDALRAGNRAKASISSEERNAISQMSEEELIKFIADIDNEMASVFDEFTKTPATRKKREKMVATTKKRAEQGKPIEVTSVNTADVIDGIFVGFNDRDSIINEVGDALLKAAEQRKAKPKQKTAIQDLIAAIRQTLTANLKGDQIKADQPSLGKLIGKTFAQQGSEAALFAKSWEDGRKKVLAMLSEMGVDDASLEEELDAIMPPTPTLAYAPAAAKRAITMAIKEAGLSARDAISNPAFFRETIMEKFNEAAAKENLTEEGWNQSGKALAEKAINEFIDSARIKAEERLAESKDKMEKRKVEIADKRASQLIYSVEELFRQNSQDLQTSKSGDSINKAFRDQLKEPVSIGKFKERLAKLSVSDQVAERLFKTAAREKADLQAMEAYRLLEGPDALKNMLREIDAMRPSETIPFSKRIPWRKILSQKASTVKEYRQRIFDAISSNINFENLSEQQKAKLADLFAESWEKKRSDILDRMLVNLINREQAANRISQEGADALRSQRQKLIEDINLGVLDKDELMKHLAEKFGIKTEFTEQEREKIDRLIEITQDESLNKVKRNKAAYELLETLSSTTKVPIAKLLADFWVSSVLSGLNTATSIALAVGSGAFELTTGLYRVIEAGLTNPKNLPQEIATSFKSMAEFLKAFKREGRLAWQYLVTGDRDFLDPSMNNVLNDLNYDSIGKSTSLAERMAKSDKILQRVMGVWMRSVSRLLTALDSLNSGVTKGGALPIVFRQLELNPVKIQEIEEKMKLENYKQQVIQRDFRGIAPTSQADKARVDSWAKAEMMADLDQYATFSENVDFIGQQGAMTLDPSGIGGLFYRGIKNLTGSIETSAEKFLARSERQWKAAKGTDKAVDSVQLALAYFLQFAAYNAANLAGLRFARFAGNKFNQGLSFIPGIGMMRTYEATWDESRIEAKEAFTDMIRRNQFIGVMFSAIGYLILKSIDDEPDDEKRGWFINGGWGNLTPDQKQQKLASGQKEYTFGIGNKVFNYQNWPIAPLLAAIGSGSDYIRFSPEKWTEKEAISRLGTVALSGVFAATEIPALSGFQTLFGNSLSSKDPNEKRVERFANVMSGWAGGFIPRILKDLDFIADPNLRKYETVWEKTASHIPIYRRYEGEEYYDILGKQIQRKVYPGSREFMEKPTDPEYKILGALNSRGIWLTPANAEHRMIGKGRNKRKLTQDEADAYSLESGKAYRQMLLRYGQRALQMPTERARAFLLDKADEARDRALKKAVR